MRTRSLARAVWCGCALVLAAADQPAGATQDAFEVPVSPAERIALNAAIHIHTQYSTGSDALESIVQDARRLGVDVVVITDDDLLEVTYGLPPWRHLFSFGRSHRSLFGEDTLSDYLAEIRRLDGLYEDVVVIDGVESAPFYHWGIDPARRHFTVQGWNKHLLAIGLDDESAYAQLPVLGGEGNWSSNRHWLLLWPVAGVMWALLSGPGRRPVRAVVIVMCLLFLADSALTGLRRPRFQPYDASVETVAHQSYLDAVHQAGGLSYWAHPEAASTIPPVQVLGGMATVASRTDRHAIDLIDTDRYTGFAALYADHITATEPGHEWDQVLTEYLRGVRQRPVWGTGEIDYHEDVEGNRLHDIMTVLWARGRTRGHVLQALRDGSSYAVRGGDERLRLNEFAGVTTVGSARSGESLVGTGEFRIVAHLDKATGVHESIDLRLIAGDEDGARVVAHIEGTTPIQLSHVDGIAAGGNRYYRLMARTRTSMLTSNPIFVRAPAVVGGDRP